MTEADEFVESLLVGGDIDVDTVEIIGPNPVENATEIPIGDVLTEDLELSEESD